MGLIIADGEQYWANGDAPSPWCGSWKHGPGHRLEYESKSYRSKYGSEYGSIAIRAAWTSKAAACPNSRVELEFQIKLISRPYAVFICFIEALD